MKKAIFGVMTIMISGVLALSSLFVAPVMAGECANGSSDAKCNKICNDSNIDDTQKAAAGCTMTSNKEDSLAFRLTNIINIVITVVGILAVLVIVIGGQRFISAGGDPGKVKQAKDMILYAVIAVIVAGLAYAIVNFVSANIESNGNKDVHTSTP